MTLELVLIRHGECTLSGTYCGRSDAPLTPQGHQQAQHLAQELQGIHPGICYASPLCRALVTAQTICSGRQIPLVVSPLLQEMDFGKAEGLRYSEMERLWPDLTRRWLSDPTQATLPEGESFTAFRQRIQQFLQKLRKESSSAPVLIVSHGGVIAMMILEIYHRPSPEFFQCVPPLGSVQNVSWVAEETESKIYS